MLRRSVTDWALIGRLCLAALQNEDRIRSGERAERRTEDEAARRHRQARETAVNGSPAKPATADARASRGRDGPPPRRKLCAILLCIAGCARALAAACETEELILCGDVEVYVLDLKAGGKKVWSWRAADHPEIPEVVRKQFRTTDDCKPVEGGSKILITSSGGGVALVERAGGRVLFWASVKDAHSTEMLPRNRVLMAGADGNRLVRQAVPLQRIHPLAGRDAVIPGVPPTPGTRHDVVDAPVLRLQLDASVLAAVAVALADPPAQSFGRFLGTRAKFTATITVGTRTGPRTVCTAWS